MFYCITCFLLYPPCFLLQILLLLFRSLCFIVWPYSPLGPPTQIYVVLLPGPLLGPFKPEICPSPPHQFLPPFFLSYTQEPILSFYLPLPLLLPFTQGPSTLYLPPYLLFPSALLPHSPLHPPPSTLPPPSFLHELSYIPFCCSFSTVLTNLPSLFFPSPFPFSILLCPAPFSLCPFSI